jgi:hypothetical protein
LPLSALCGAVVRRRVIVVDRGRGGGQLREIDDGSTWKRSLHVAVQRTLRRGKDTPIQLCKTPTSSVEHNLQNDVDFQQARSSSQ